MAPPLQLSQPSSETRTVTYFASGGAQSISVLLLLAAYIEISVNMLHLNNSRAWLLGLKHFNFPSQCS